MSGERGALKLGLRLPVWSVSWSEALEVDSLGSCGQVLYPGKACCVAVRSGPNLLASGEEENSLSGLLWPDTQMNLPLIHLFLFLYL